MTWTDATTPFDGGTVYGGCWASDLLKFLAVGNDSGFTRSIMTSTDGASWSTSPQPLFDNWYAYSVLRDLFHGAYVIAGQASDGSAFATSPDGATWTGRGNPLATAGPVSGAACYGAQFWVCGNDASAAHQAAATSDDGATWTLYAPFGTNGNANGIAVRQSDGLIAVAGGGDAGTGVSVSSDGGATWTITSPPAPMQTASYLAFRESDGLLVAVGTDTFAHTRVSVSADGGATWGTSVNPVSGLTGITIPWGVAVRQSDGHIFAVGYSYSSPNQPGYVAVSSDGGATWTVHQPHGATGETEVTAVAIRESDGAVLILEDTSNTNRAFSVSTDSGATWTHTDVTPHGGSGVAVRASDGLIAITSPDSRVGLSSDGGSSFSFTLLPGSNFYTRCVIRQSDGAIASFSNLPSISYDSSTWTAMNAPFASPGTGVGRSLACKQSTGLLIAGGSATLNHATSSDGGATWSSLSANPFDKGGSLTGIDYSPGDDAWMAAGTDSTGSGVIVAISGDDGATWTSLSPPLITGYAPPAVYRDEANAKWWAVCTTSTGKTAAVSGDGGATWTEVSTPLDGGYAFAMLNVGGTLVIVGSDPTHTKQVVVSTDAGATWHFDDSPSPMGTGGSGEGRVIAYSPVMPRALIMGDGS